MAAHDVTIAMSDFIGAIEDNAPRVPFNCFEKNRARGLVGLRTFVAWLAHVGTNDLRPVRFGSSLRARRFMGRPDRDTPAEIDQAKPMPAAGAIGRSSVLIFLGLLGGIVLGYFIGRTTGSHSRHGNSGRWESETRTLLKSGPWGELEAVPMTIAAPEEMLPVNTMESAGTHWALPGFSRDDLIGLLQSLEVPQEQQDQLLGPECCHASPNGLVLTPSCDAIMALSPKARLGLYQRLALFSENARELHFFALADLDNRFVANHVANETVALFKKAGCAYGNYFVVSGLSGLLSKIPAYEEKARLMKALTSQKTLLLRVHVTPESDLNALVAYWGRACWNTDVKAILESLSRVPGGSWVDIVELLPPHPTALLYTYPLPDNPLNGPVVPRDCHWTSFNFFRDPPSPKYSDPSYIMEHLKLDYYPVSSDPRYGDIVLFSKPDGSIIHSAVFLADNVAYTKNGDTPIHPWMLSTISDLIEQYSFSVRPDEKLVVSYYRNKYY